MNEEQIKKIQEICVETTTELIRIYKEFLETIEELKKSDNKKEEV